MELKYLVKQPFYIHSFVKLFNLNSFTCLYSVSGTLKNVKYTPQIWTLIDKFYLDIRDTMGVSVLLLPFA